jgi:hypothetical protein
MDVVRDILRGINEVSAAGQSPSAVLPIFSISPSRGGSCACPGGSRAAPIEY